jgi:hypothetical protein
MGDGGMSRWNTAASAGRTVAILHDAWKGAEPPPCRRGGPVPSPAVKQGGTDPDALAIAVLASIGRGKSYGAGLLSLAPAATP